VNELDSQALVDLAAETVAAGKAIDPVVLDMSKISLVADNFVIASGASRTQVLALARRVEDKLAEAGVHPLHREGDDTGHWWLLDYGAMVVHIFDPDTRSFYDLEHLWTNAPATHVK
jgi:ribosome-associated protein